MEESEYEVMASVEDGHFWFVGTRAIVKDAFVRAGLRRDHRVLDIGCGTGGTMRALDGAADFVGLDVSLKAARLAFRRTGNPIMAGSAVAPPFLDESFDCVLALDVFEHIEDDLSAIRQVRRILRPGGVLIATVPCHPFLFSEHDEALHHVRRYTRKGFVDLLNSVGMRTERVTWTNTILFPAAAVYRLAANGLRGRDKAPKSNAAIRTGALNGLLTRVFMVERRMIARFDMPFGLGLLTVARR
ncbi:MAG: class I SAM-dependent methyltransferase [Deltaproteobacteria bacterium]|nr:class I SAM-dependent methyltransferase [Deltaproteobacteria bacterium]